MKRTMTPEHKAKMAEGRRRRMEEQSRSRPASRPDPAPMPQERPLGFQADQTLEDLIRTGGEGLTRESNFAGQHAFDVPMAGRIPGWDYQWWDTHVIGQEVDPSYAVEIAKGSWFPVPASHFPQLVPRGWTRNTIDRLGMRLYMRPMRLTEEAREEQRRMAYEQKQQRLMMAQAGDTGTEMAKRTLTNIDVRVRSLDEG